MLKYGAALVGLCLVLAACGIGSRATSHRSAPEPSAKGRTTSQPTPDPWASLRARPLKTSSLTPGQPCPVSPLVDPNPAVFGKARGTGPVYAVGGTRLGARALNKVLWEADPVYQGAILIRGFRLDGEGVLLFDAAGGNHPAFPRITVQVSNPVRDYAVYPELALSEAGTPTGAPWRGWPSYTYAAAPGCYAWQVDGSSFTELIITQIL